MTPDEYNNDCIQALKAANLSDYIAVVGSGLSSPYIAPVGTLKRKLSEACGIEPLEGEHLWVFCQRAHDANPDAYVQVLQDSYSGTPYWDALVYRYLINMPFRGFATLNYDRQLPSAFAERYPDDCNERFSVYPPSNNGYFQATQLIADEPRLIAIHGFADPNDPKWADRVILKTDDYNAHYTGTNPPLIGWWQTLLATNPCIFIGTSLKEPGIELALKDASTALREAIAAKRHLHLLPCERSPGHPHYPIPGHSFFAIRQTYYDKKDERHTGLIDVLSAFSGFRSITPSPRSTSIPGLSATSDHHFPDVP